jgi:hypothetical protein
MAAPRRVSWRIVEMECQMLTLCLAGRYNRTRGWEDCLRTLTLNRESMAKACQVNIVELLLGELERCHL